jgi:hypothetical protein
MISIDERSLGRFLPLILEVNRLCGQPRGEELLRELTQLAVTCPDDFERLVPEILGRVKRVARQVHGASVIPFPGPTDPSTR